LTGDILNEDEAFNEAKSTNAIVCVLLLVNKQFLAVYLDDMPAAQATTSRLQRWKGCHMAPCTRAKLIFQEAFVAARQARTSSQQRKIAMRSLSTLKRFAESCPQNFQNKVYLVEAEVDASTGNFQKALDKYKLSIEWATEQKFIHEQGLACERAGHLLRDNGMFDDARKYFHQASSCYASWGATVKVDQLGLLVTS
jgi:tetratricopeptide (TPR) repeat protein